MASWMPLASALASASFDEITKVYFFFFLEVYDIDLPIDLNIYPVIDFLLILQFSKL